MHKRSEIHKKNSVTKPESNISLEELPKQLENNIKMDLEVTECEVGYIWCRRGLAVGPPIYSMNHQVS
jgi:hypothetical protein